MNMRSTKLINRFFLFWLGLIYLSGLWQLSGRNPKDLAVLTQCISHTAQKIDCRFSDLFFGGMNTNLTLILLFSLSLLLYALLLYIGLIGKIPTRFSLPYFLLQGCFIFVIGQIIRNVALSENIILSLYLLLIMSTVIILRPNVVMFVIVISYILIYVLIILWKLWIANAGDWASFLAIVGMKTDVTLIPFLFGYLIFFGQLQYVHTQLAGSYSKLEETHRQLQFSNECLEEMTLSAERQRMARELHDTLAQGLTGLHLQLEAIQIGLRLQRYEQVQKMVNRSLEGTRTTLIEVRRAIDDVRNATLFPENLPLLVQVDIDRLVFTSGLLCVTNLDALIAVPPGLCEHILRFITECLTNVVRHARAKRLWVLATQNEGYLTVEVRDDGIGFDPMTRVNNAGHYGLSGLRERAQLIGAQYILESSPGKGTILQLILPLPIKALSIEERHEDEKYMQ